jgi:hypothetical protein
MTDIVTKYKILVFIVLGMNKLWGILNNLAFNAQLDQALLENRGWWRVASEHREIEGISNLENLRRLGIETLCGHLESAVIDTPLQTRSTLVSRLSTIL